MAKNSAREYAILYVGGKKVNGSTAGGGNVLLNAGTHSLDGPEHSGAGDTVRLDTSTGAHGLMPKLSGDAADVFHGDGTQTPVDIADVTTASTDASLVAAPDGTGGITFRAETGGMGSGWAPIMDGLGNVLVDSGTGAAIMGFVYF